MWLQSRYDSLDSCSALDNPEDSLLADLPGLGTQAPSTPMGMCYAPVPQTPRMRTVPMYPKSAFTRECELPPFQVRPCRPIACAVLCYPVYVVHWAVCVPPSSMYSSQSSMACHLSDYRVLLLQLLPSHGVKILSFWFALQDSVPMEMSARRPPLAVKPDQAVHRQPVRVSKRKPAKYNDNESFTLGEHP